MKNNLLILFLFFSFLGAMAQVPYYGTPFYKEGFDVETLSTLEWVQEGTSYSASGEPTPTTTAWKTTNSIFPINKRFSGADPNSTYSLSCNIARNYGLVGTFTSPLITNTESSVCVGFSGCQFSTAFPVGYGYMAFQISKDNGATWEDLWRSDGKATGHIYSETVLNEAGINIFAGWSTIIVNLPAAYDNQDFKVRFHVNSEDIRETSAMELLIDGVFVSKRRAIDVKISTITGFNSKGTNIGAYFLTPVTVNFTNTGTSPISSIGMTYTITPTGQTMTETYTPTTPIAADETASYTFITKADLSALRSSYTMKVSLQLEGDSYTADNELSFNINNVMTDVPYTAQWMRQPEVDDAWVRIQEGAVAVFPFWSFGVTGKDTTIYCDASTKTVDADSYYFSRPVSLKKGKKYEFSFSTFTQSDNSSDKNTLQVFVATRLDTLSRVGSPLFYATDINNAGRLNQTFVITPTQDTSYYFVFRALCKAGNKTLHVKDVGVREMADIDARIISLVAPKDKTFRFTASEQVQITVGNAGLQAIPANTLKVHYQFEEGNIVTETVAKALAAHENTTHTFASTVNMSQIGKYHLKAWVSLANDNIHGNDTLDNILNTLVTELPYNGSLGANMFSRTYEEEYWVSENWGLAMLGADASWQYGGYSFSKDKVGYLYSRPIHLKAGQVCEFNYQIKRDSDTDIIPLQIGVYKKQNEVFNRTDSITTIQINSARNAYVPYTSFFTALEEGDYYFGFVAKPTSNINTSVYLKEINFAEAKSHDLVMDKVLLPAAQVTNLDSLPIGVVVKNKGRQPASSYTISCQVNDQTPVTETINVALAPDGYQTCYFKNKFVFNGTGNETVKVWVTLAGDEDTTNDKIESKIQNVANATIPYNMFSLSAVADWLVFDENKDGNRWKQVSSPRGFIYEGGNETANDYLLTKHFNLEQGKTYKLSFESVATSKDKPFNLSVLYGKSNHTDKLTPLIHYKNIVETSAFNSLLVYLTPETTAGHVFGFHVEGTTNTASVANSFSVTEALGMPDAKIELLYPLSNDVFAAEDSIVFQVRNIGKDIIAGLPIECKLNDEVIYATILYDQIGVNQTYKFKIENVNMFEPREYKIEVDAGLTYDANLENNKAAITVKGLPKSDVEIVSIINPYSGKAKAAADVTILIKNGGNTPVSDVSVVYKLNDVVVTEKIIQEIAANNTYEYTFNQKLDISSSAVYEMTAYVDYANDINHENDTLRKTFHVTDQLVDVAVTELVAPVTGTLTNAETVTVMVKNNSTIPLTVPLSYSIDNGTKVTALLDMEASSTVTYSFAEKTNMSGVKSYNVLVIAEFPDDEVSGNNSIQRVVEYLKKDLGVSQIIYPTSQFQLSNETRITVEIKNHGLNPIQETSVSYVINDGEPVTENVVFSEELNPEELYNYTFTQKADMSESKDYKIVAYTSLTGDINPDNDKATKNIPYVIQQYGDLSNPVGIGAGTLQGASLLPDGSLFCSYWKSNGGNYDMYVQLLDQTGAPLLDKDGLLVSNNERTFAVINTSTLDKEGNYILGFTNLSDFSAGDPSHSGQLCISKISRTGAYVFGEKGKPIGDKELLFSTATIIRTDSRGYIYLSTNSGKLYKIDKNTGEVIKSISQRVGAMEIDDKDNLYITYGGESGALHMIMMDTNLEAVTYPIVVSESGATGASIILFDSENSGETGVWVCYHSSMYAGTYFVQYVDSDMRPQIGKTGVAISNGTASAPAYGWPAVIRDTENALAFVTSETATGGSMYSFLKGQVVTKSGELRLGEKGKDILPSSEIMDYRALGLNYHKGNLYLSYSSYQGTGSRLRTNIDAAICDLEFNITKSVRYAQSVYDIGRTSINHDAYGIYGAWKGGDLASAQHLYYDETLQNKQYSVRVESDNYDQGYAVGGGLFDNNGEATIKASSVPGFFFKEWNIEGETVSTSNPYTFPVTKALKVTAVFTEVVEYQITASAGANGSIDPAGVVIVEGGSDKTFTMNPDSGYVVDDILVDNVSVGAADTYTFKNITGDHEIKVTFKLQVGIDGADRTQLKAYPNPTTGQVRITNGDVRINGARVFDITGRLLMEMNNINHTDVKVDLSPYAAGSYFVEIDGKTVKVMKQ